MSFGTLQINQSSRTDLIWGYKQGFEAMANIAYQYQANQRKFESPMITTLEKLHQDNIRIHVDDFEKIPTKCITSMLQYPWIFDEWSTDEIYEALLLSIRSKSNKTRKENHIFNTRQKNQIIGKLMEMGHPLYPFCTVEYDEAIIRQLADNQIILFTKCAGINAKDLDASYTKFLSFFRIDALPATQSELNDLNLLSEIMSHTFLTEERYYYIKKLWQLRTAYKRTTYEALKSSDMHYSKNWEANLTKVISDYL